MYTPFPGYLDHKNRFSFLKICSPVSSHPGSLLVLIIFNINPGLKATPETERSVRSCFPAGRCHNFWKDNIPTYGKCLAGNSKNPTGNKPIDEFAVIIQNIPKIVFSRTLTEVQWENAILTKGDLKEEISELKKQPGKDILVGSPGLIAALRKLNLISEYQLCVHSVIAGSGLPLFKNITDRVILNLLKTKTFSSGAIILCYEPAK